MQQILNEPQIVDAITEKDLNIHLLREPLIETIPDLQNLPMLLKFPKINFFSLSLEGFDDTSEESWENEYTIALNQAINYYDTLKTDQSKNLSLLLLTKLDAARFIQKYFKTTDSQAKIDYRMQYGIYKKAMIHNGSQEYYTIEVIKKRSSLSSFPVGLVLFPGAEMQNEITKIEYRLPEGFQMPGNKILKVGGLSLNLVKYEFSAEQKIQAGNVAVIVIELQETLTEVDIGDYFRVSTEGSTLVLEVTDKALELEKLKVSVQVDNKSNIEL